MCGSSIILKPLALKQKQQGYDLVTHFAFNWLLLTFFFLQMKPFSCAIHHFHQLKYHVQISHGSFMVDCVTLTQYVCAEVNRVSCELLAV